MSVMLYKCPGPHRLHEIMCDYCIVESTELDATLASGEWHRTPTDAQAAHKGDEPVAVEKWAAEVDAEPKEKKPGKKKRGRPPKAKLKGEG